LLLARAITAEWHSVGAWQLAGPLLFACDEISSWGGQKPVREEIQEVGVTAVAECARLATLCRLESGVGRRQ
jgi:hypothetical protein